MASAGSGKTYRLVLRAIELLHAGAAVDDLLAGTFTRNAAGEIRDRILERLCDAASSPEAAEALEADLRRHPTIPWAERARMTQDRARLLLVDVARQVHRLQVRTLDGFFAAIVAAFPVETGVPAGSRILDETEERRLRADAISALLGDPDHGGAVVRLLRTLTQGRSDSGVDRLIDATIGEAWSAWRDSEVDAWRTLRVPVAPGESVFAAAVADIAAYMESAACPGGLATALATMLACVESEEWEQIARKGPAKNVAAGTPIYSKKPLDDDLVASIEILLERVRHELRRMHRERTEAMAELCARFEAYFEHLKRERGRLGFDDLSERLRSGADVTDDFDRLAWRLDARLEHLLLDEFQDTSVRQWDVLEPIARRLVEDLSEQRTLFVVGDVKQSIYGWRSGRPEILEHLPETLLGEAADHIGQEPLMVSWRSSPVVLDVVNTIFGRLPRNPIAVEDDAAREAASQWDTIWETHAAAEKNRELPGYVELRTGRERLDVGHSSAAAARHREEAVRAAVAKVIDWHARMPEASIGVLVRTRAAAEQVLESLRRADPPVDAIGPGGRPLVDEPAVTAVLSLLRLADHPDDRAAAFHVAEGPLGPLVGLTPAVARDPDKLPRAAEALSARIRDRLARDGLAATIGELVRRLSPHCDAGQVGRLRHLRELAAEREADLGPRPSEFVAIAEAMRAPEPARGSVSVLTVHASKGLEFDLVVATDLGGELSRSDTLLVDRGPEDGRVRMVHTRVSKEDAWILGPDEQRAVDRVRASQVRESFCLLYVAMTRARQGLSLVIPAPNLKKDGTETFPAKRFHGLLRGALIPDDLPAPDAMVWHEGDEDALVASRPGAATERDAEDVAAAVAVVAAEAADASGRQEAAERGLRVRPPRQPRPISAAAAAETAEATVPLAQRLRPASREPRDRGTAIHALLESITWLDAGGEAGGGAPSADEATRFVRREVPRRPEAWARERAGELPAMLGHPAIRDLLSLGGRDPDRVVVDAERPWVRADARGVQRGFIDRVEIERDASGAIERVRIIDWKTDPLGPEADVAERQRHLDRYAPQIEAYRGVMAAATGLPPERIEAVLAFVSTGLVLAVPPGSA
jgi:ATP-dependent exoDNAse (exonuclease V) beta subunit